MHLLVDLINTLSQYLGYYWSLERHGEEYRFTNPYTHREYIITAETSKRVLVYEAHTLRGVQIEMGHRSLRYRYGADRWFEHCECLKTIVELYFQRLDA